MYAINSVAPDEQLACDSQINNRQIHDDRCSQKSTFGRLKRSCIYPVPISSISCIETQLGNRERSLAELNLSR